MDDATGAQPRLLVRIYDAVPRQLCMHEANTVHTTSMHIVVAAMAAKFEGNVNDGDVFLCTTPMAATPTWET